MAGADAGGPIVMAVVVTHNRLDMLRQCVEALRTQTRRPDRLIVVDNASEQDTASWLAAQSDLMHVRQDNLGSSGGQYTGIRIACDQGADWVWCMDDDTCPLPEALEKLLDTPQLHEPDTVFLASVAEWRDGSVHEHNRPNWHFHPLPDARLAPDQPPASITGNTFVSLLLRIKAVRQFGLPLKDFFIWYDDAEYTTRLSRRGKGYVVPASRVQHLTPGNVQEPLDLNSPGSYFKHWYGLRNMMVFHRRRPAPKILIPGYLAWNFSRYAVRLWHRPKGWKLIGRMLRGLFWFPRVTFPDAPVGTASKR